LSSSDSDRSLLTLRLVVFIFACILAIAKLAGLLDRGEAESHRPTPPIRMFWTVDEVKTAFVRADVKLEAERFGPLLLLGPPLGATTDDRFGSFQIYVTSDALERDVLLRDDRGRDVEPTRDGIYWQRSFDGWRASKVFDNLILAWDTKPNGERRTNEGWDALVAILGSLERSSGPRSRRQSSQAVGASSWRTTASVPPARHSLQRFAKSWCGPPAASKPSLLVSLERDSDGGHPGGGCARQ
jgi:hypothetical protein